jgi:hypothetical protein
VSSGSSRITSLPRDHISYPAHQGWKAGLEVGTSNNMYGHVTLELFLSGFCLAADGYVLRGKHRSGLRQPIVFQHVWKTQFSFENKGLYWVTRAHG